MVKEYKLKESQALIKPNKINRILKKIFDNVSSDRKDAKDLLAQAKILLLDLVSARNHVQDTGEVPDLGNMPSVDNLTKAITTAVTALGQMGKTNETLLKLAALCQKFNDTGAKNDTKVSAKKSSVFSLMEKIAEEKEESDD